MATVALMPPRCVGRGGRQTAFGDRKSSKKASRKSSIVSAPALARRLPSTRQSR
jgi:hypothetical protein